MWFDGQRQPNTVYVANTSRGKDSTAMLRAIQLMGWPLDMICSVDIWATQDIPAELPPMVAFKDEYDKKVLDWFGIPVTRLCATKERETERVSYESVFYKRVTTDKYAGHIYGFPAINGSWCKTLKQTDKPRFDFTADIRGHLLSADNPEERERERSTAARSASGEETSEYTDSRSTTGRGATATSNAPHFRLPESEPPVVQRRAQKGGSKPRRTSYGFPMQTTPWCNSKLKAGVLDHPSHSPRTRGRK